MLRRLPLLVVLLLLATPAGGEPEADARALGSALQDPDLEVAARAASELRALGKAARPATEDLIRALDRRLPPGLRKRHWHPWRGLLPTFRKDVVTSLLAIGPSARKALAALLEYLHQARSSRGQPLDWLVRPLFDDWRDEVPAAKEGLLAWAARGRLGLSPALQQRFVRWLSDLEEEAYPIWDAWLASPRADREAALHALGRAGDRGLLILRKHFQDERGLQDGMLRMWIRAGFLPTFAHDVAVERLATESMEKEAPALVMILASMQADVSRQLAARLPEQRLHWTTWRTLSSYGASFGRRVGRHWFAAHAPTPATEGFDESGQRSTPALGGSGGRAFSESREGLLVGLRYTYDLVDWVPALRSVQGLYRHKGEITSGRVFGTRGARGGTVMSKPGYAIGGLYAQHGTRFQGFAVVFMRHGTGTLDPTDAYIDTWHGGVMTGQQETRLGGEGHEIVGLHGRAGSDIDALGLIERRVGHARSD